VLCRPHSTINADWREVDEGPGVIHLPPGEEASLRAKNMYDDELATLVSEIKGCTAIIGLNLSENRNLTNEGLAYLARLPQLTYLNLSSCALTNHGFVHLLALPLLQYLELSYCNRITDVGVRQLKTLRNLSYLGLQGCVKVSNGSISKLRRSGLTIRF
jgi:Leucine-rich repeat (LRR) protein